jgi:hypothetical protein
MTTTEPRAAVDVAPDDPAVAAARLFPPSFVRALVTEPAHTLTTDTPGSTHEQGF